jgi:hypothetical protein
VHEYKGLRREVWFPYAVAASHIPTVRFEHSGILQRVLRQAGIYFASKQSEEILKTLQTSHTHLLSIFIK